MIKITPTTIDLGSEVPDRPTDREVEPVMRAVSAALGGTWSAFRLSGAWFIDRDGEIVAGDSARGQRRRANFSAALADGTRLAVIREVPVR